MSDAPDNQDNVVPLRGSGPPSTPNDPHFAEVLSFMSKRKPKGTGIDYWDVTPTGSYSDDCETGRALAEEYLTFIGSNPTAGNATLLTCIVREMIDRAANGGQWSGVHVGFLAGVNHHAMAAALLDAQVRV